MSKCFFRPEWMNDPNFSWLRPVPNNAGVARCDLCNFQFSLSNMGLRAVKSHQSGKKHQLREKGSSVSSISIKSLFPTLNASSDQLPQSSSTTPQQSISIPVSESTDSELHKQQNISVTNAQSSGIAKFLFKESVTCSEVMWCLQAIMTHKSLRSAEKDVKLFSKLFPDSEIAKCMQLGRDKMAYTFLYGIAPFFKEKLLEKLNSCSHFVVGFDESINKVAQKQQMDLNVRFWCQESNEVKTQYLNSAFLGRTRSNDLLIAFKDAVSPLDLKKVLQISMDGPNVNTKFFRELLDDIKETPEDPEILNLGSCGLHAINVAFKTGAKSTGWNLEQFHRSLYYLFKDSPARRAMFTNYTDSKEFPLKFCSVRWLENSKVTERSQNILPKMKAFIDGMEKDKQTPTSKSYEVVKKAVNDHLMPAKLAFFQMLSSEMESFLRQYQTDTPLIPFLYTDLHSLLQMLMARFLKAEVMKQNLIEIDLDDSSNLLTYKNVDIGISTQCQLRKLKASDSEIKNFRNDCRTFLIHITRKVKERSPLIYEMTSAVSCFDPSVSVRENLFSKRLSSLLLILCSRNWITATVADRAKSQLKHLCSQPHIISKLKSYSRSERIDKFWFNLLTEEKNCDEGISIIKIVMVLSHGNANIERGFSINSDCLLENMKQESLVSRRIIYDGILAMGGIENFEVTKPLVLHSRNARSKFAEAKTKQQNEDKEKVAAVKLKRQAELEMQKLQTKKAKIIEEAHREANKIEEEIATLRLLKK